MGVVKIARCGCGGSGSGGTVVADGTRVYASGSGTADDPYIFDLAADFLQGDNNFASGTTTVDGSGQEGSPFVVGFESNGNVDETYTLIQTITTTPFALNSQVDLNADSPYTVLLLSSGINFALTLTNASIAVTGGMQRFRVLVRATAAITLTLPAEGSGVKWTGGAVPAPIAMASGQILEFEFTGVYAWNSWLARQVNATPYA